MDKAEYSLSQVAAAAGVDVGTLRSWLQRGHWRLDMAIGDSPAEVAGKAHLITLRRALHIGTAAELVRNGVEPRRAFNVARAFTDLSFVDGPTAGPPRDPGGLFPSGSTVLIASPDSDEGTVVWLDERAPDARSILTHAFGRRVSGTFVWLNFIDKRVRTALEGGARV